MLNQGRVIILRVFRPEFEEPAKLLRLIISAKSAALYSNGEHWEVSNSTVSLVKSPSIEFMWFIKWYMSSMFKFCKKKDSCLLLSQTAQRTVDDHYQLVQLALQTQQDNSTMKYKHHSVHHLAYDQMVIF